MNNILHDKSITDLFPYVSNLAYYVQNQLTFTTTLHDFSQNDQRQITGFYANHFDTLSCPPPMVRLIYITNGQAQLTVNQQTFTIGSNALLLVNQYTEFSLTNIQDCEFIFFAIKPEYFDSTKLVSLLDAASFKRFSFPKNPIVEIPQFELYAFKDYFTFTVLAYLLLQQVARMDETHTELTYTAFAMLINELNSCHDDLIRSTTEVHENPTNEILAYAKQNLQTFSLTATAQHFHLSPDYLSHLVSSTTGHPLTYHVRHYRLDLARKLLRHPDLSIDDVIHQLGYHDKTYFYKIFKAENHITPLQYRKRVLMIKRGAN